MVVVQEPRLTSPNEADWRKEVALRGREVRSLISIEPSEDGRTMKFGSQCKVNGALYESLADETIAGWNSGWSDYTGVYVYAIPNSDGVSAQLQFSLTEPTYSAAKGGWYDGNNRALAFGYKLGTSLVVTEYIQGLRENNALVNIENRGWSNILIESNKVKAGSAYEAAGRIFGNSSDATPTGWTSTWRNYSGVYLYGSPAALATSTYKWSQTVPTFDVSKGGWYNGNDRALAFGYKLNTVFVLTEYIHSLRENNQIVSIEQRGYINIAVDNKTVKAYSAYEANGAVYGNIADVAATGWDNAWSHDIYLYANPNGTVNSDYSFSNTAPTYNLQKGGWYNGNDRALARGINDGSGNFKVLDILTNFNRGVSNMAYELVWSGNTDFESSSLPTGDYFAVLSAGKVGHGGNGGDSDSAKGYVNNVVEKIEVIEKRFFLPESATLRIEVAKNGTDGTNGTNGTNGAGGGAGGNGGCSEAGTRLKINNSTLFEARNQIEYSIGGGGAGSSGGSSGNFTNPSKNGNSDGSGGNGGDGQIYDGAGGGGSSGDGMGPTNTSSNTTTPGLGGPGGLGTPGKGGGGTNPQYVGQPGTNGTLLTTGEMQYLYRITA